MNERIALYSSSLYAVAVENGCVKGVYDSLKLVEKILRENEGYEKIISSKAISLPEREKLLEEAFLGNVHEFVLNFMKILAKKRVFDVLLPSVKEFEKQYLKDNNIEHAKIVTAFELSDEKKAEVVRKIHTATGKNIVPVFEVDESIMGGIVIETAASSIDASVKSRLSALERYISKI